MRTRMSPESLAVRHQNVVQRIREGEALLAAGERDLEALRQWAREDGLARELRALEHPREPKPPAWEPTQRVRVLRPYAVMGKNPYGPELYAAGAESVVDVPLSLVKRLGDRVEPVPAETPIDHRPAPTGTPQD